MKLSESEGGCIVERGLFQSLVSCCYQMAVGTVLLMMEIVSIHRSSDHQSSDSTDFCEKRRRSKNLAKISPLNKKEIMLLFAKCRPHPFVFQYI